MIDITLRAVKSMFFAIAGIMVVFTSGGIQCVAEETGRAKKIVQAPYLLAPLDLRSSHDYASFSKIILNSNEQPVYLNLQSDFSAPCDGWMDSPIHSAQDGRRCDWLITLTSCDPVALFGEAVSATDASTCSPLLYIENPQGETNNRVKVCPGNGYQLAGFYSIQYVEAKFGRALYKAVPIRIRFESGDSKAIAKMIAEQTCSFGSDK